MNATRKFTIEVEIGNERYSCADSCSYPNYKVYINPDEVKELGAGKPIHAAAHEIGHVLAHAFGLPYSKQVNDPCSALRYETDRDFCMGLENEAWDIAEMMALKRKALKGYEDNFQPLIFNSDMKNALP